MVVALRPCKHIDERQGMMVSTLSYACPCLWKGWVVMQPEIERGQEITHCDEEMCTLSICLPIGGLQTLRAPASMCPLSAVHCFKYKPLDSGEAQLVLT